MFGEQLQRDGDPVDGGVEAEVRGQRLVDVEVADLEEAVQLGQERVQSPLVEGRPWAQPWSVRSTAEPGGSASAA